MSGAHPCHVSLCPHVLGLTEPLRRLISLVGPEGVGLVSGGHLHAVGQDDFSSLSLHLFISGDCGPQIVLMCFSDDELHTCRGFKHLDRDVFY